MSQISRNETAPMEQEEEAPAAAPAVADAPASASASAAEAVACEEEETEPVVVAAAAPASAAAAAAAPEPVPVPAPAPAVVEQVAPSPVRVPSPSPVIAAAAVVAVAAATAAANAATVTVVKSDKDEKTPIKPPKKSNGVVVAAAAPAAAAAGPVITKENGIYFCDGMQVDMSRDSGVFYAGACHVIRDLSKRAANRTIDVSDVVEPLGPGDKAARDAALKHLSSNGNYLLARVPCDGFRHSTAPITSVRIMTGVGSEKVDFLPFVVHVKAAERKEVYDHKNMKLNPFDVVAKFLFENGLIKAPYTAAISCDARVSPTKLLLADQTRHYLQGILLFVKNEDKATHRERPYVPYFHTMGEQSLQGKYDRKTDYDALRELKLQAKTSHVRDDDITVGNFNRQDITFEIAGYRVEHTGYRSLIPERCCTWNPHNHTPEMNEKNIESRAHHGVRVTEKELCSEVKAMTEDQFKLIFKDVSVEDTEVKTPRKRKGSSAAAAASSDIATPVTEKRRGRPPGSKNKKLKPTPPPSKLVEVEKDDDATDSEPEAESQPEPDTKIDKFVKLLSKLTSMLETSYDGKTDVVLSCPMNGFCDFAWSNVGKTHPVVIMNSGSLCINIVVSLKMSKLLLKEPGVVLYKGMAHPVDAYMLQHTVSVPVPWSSTVRRMNGESSPVSSSSSAAAAAADDVDEE